MVLYQDSWKIVNDYLKKVLHEFHTMSITKGQSTIQNVKGSVKMKIFRLIICIDLFTKDSQGNIMSFKHLISHNQGTFKG